MNIDLFLLSLPIMLKGMAGIFTVTGIIIAATLLISRIGVTKPEE